MVNLVDKKGSQGRIGEKFTQLFKQLKDDQLNYVWFDFHCECKNMKYENLSKLIDICQQELDAYGHFMVELDHGFDLRFEFNK